MAEESDMSIIGEIIDIQGFGKPSTYDGFSTEQLKRHLDKVRKEAEGKMSGGPVKKKKKAYVKPKMMGHGGMAYRGRTYAYGGRVSKYKG